MCAGCDDDDTFVPVLPSETGSFTDSDGETYGWAKYGNLYWMTENYRGGTEPYYEQHIDDGWGDNQLDIDEEEEGKATFDIYGNYYSFQEAKEYAPEGWEPPTDEDWKNLEQALGIPAAETDIRGERGENIGLMLQSKETLGLKTGGLLMGFGSPYTLRFRNLRIHGYYWTATEDTTATFTAASYRKVSNYTSGIERNSIVEALEDSRKLVYTRMSVRYVSRTRSE